VSADTDIRRATSGDVDGIIVVEHASFSTPEEIFTRQQVRALIANPRATVLVATSGDGMIAGWAGGLIRRHRGGASGRLYAIAVHPSARGAKFGRRLLEAVLAGLHAGGANKVYLEVRADNHAAINLYKTAGFTFRKDLPDYYGPARHGVSMIRE